LEATREIQYKIQENFNYNLTFWNKEINGKQIVVRKFMNIGQDINDKGVENKIIINEPIGTYKVYSDWVHIPKILLFNIFSQENKPLKWYNGIYADYEIRQELVVLIKQ